MGRYENSGTGKGFGPVTAATTTAAAVVMVLAWIVESVFGIQVPAEIQGATGVILVALAGYFTPGNGKRVSQ